MSEENESVNQIHPKKEASGVSEGSAAPDASQDTKGEEMLNLKVTDNQTDISFKVKMKTPFKRIIEAFCKRTGKEKRSLRFVFEGEHINETDSPATLGMEDGDCIEALNQQSGGVSN